jgi:hypothetical protein
MRQYPEIYIHTYFVDNRLITCTNVTEREKIRDSIRTCCETMGEEFTERGIIESNDHMYEEGIGHLEQLLQMDRNRMNELLPEYGN